MRDLVWEDGIHVLAGPVGSGKTSTGLRLAAFASEACGASSAAHAVAIIAPDAEIPGDVSSRLLSIEHFRTKDVDRAQQFREAIEDGAHVIYLDNLSTGPEMREVIDAAMEGVLVFCSMTELVGGAAGKMDSLCWNEPNRYLTLLSGAWRTVNNLMLVQGEYGDHLFTFQERWAESPAGEGEGDGERLRKTHRALPPKRAARVSGKDRFERLAEARPFAERLAKARANNAAGHRRPRPNDGT